MSLPDDDERVFIFVPTMRMLPYLRAMIQDLRGRRLLENAKFLSAGKVEDALHQMRGRPVDRIFADHAAFAAVTALAWRREFAFA